MSHRGSGINYTGLVYRVLHGAGGGLTLDEIVAGVSALEPINATSPRALVLCILEQSELVQPTGPGRYGYLPRLLEGNTFRQPLERSASWQGPVELTPEVRVALWPGRAQPRPGQEGPPAQLELPDGTRACLERHHRAACHWGFTASAELWQWLRSGGLRPGDDLIIRVLNAEERRYSAELESRLQRDAEAVARRNREVVRQAAVVVGAAGGEMPLDDLAPLLVAAGAYRDPVAPDSLWSVLAQDGRFLPAGPGAVVLAR